MSRRPPPLPPELERVRWFTTTRARELGVTRATLATLVQPHRGVHGRTMPTTVREDAQALALVLPPGCAFSHVSAAWLLELPVPVRWTPGPRPPLDVGRKVGTPPRRAGVLGHRLGPEVSTVTLPGLMVPVVAPVHVFRQLAGVLPHRDLVVLGDLCLPWRSGASRDDMARVVRSAGPGVVAARRALKQVRPGVNSAMESHMRIDLSQLGLPEPELNAEVLDEHGQRVAFVDFLWRRQKVVVEYNGAYHFDTPEQRLADEARRNRLERLGYLVINVNRVDYFQHREETLAAIARAVLERTP